MSRACQQLRPRSVLAAVFFIALAGVAEPCSAGELWQPQGIVPVAVTTQSVLDLYHRAIASRPPSWTGRFRIAAGDATVDATVAVRGLDYRVDATVDGAQYAMGRQGGTRWRRTPAGVVRVIRSDVQGDALDRWPLAILKFDENDCKAIGQGEIDGAPWVLACNTLGDIPHWYYVDRTSGSIVREISRDGSRVNEYAFDGDGGWRVTGAGGDATVTRVAMDPTNVSAGAVAIPDSATQTFEIAPGKPADIPADVGFDIVVRAKLNGWVLNFVVDTGTTQMLIDERAAVKLRLSQTLGHAVASRVEVGSAVATNVPFQVVDLFGGVWDGILGNEFFIGHIVHIDYANRRLELIDEGDFFPPAGTVQVPLYCDEGMPLVAASAGSVSGSRFAIDTGSQAILLSDAFARQSGSGVSFTGAPEGTDLRFLEGWTTVRTADLPSLVFSGVNFRHRAIYVEVPRATNLDIPLDGILGSAFLETFEWWFDYDHNRAWIRYRG